MRRFSRFLLYAGTLAMVLGMGKVHASRVATEPYDFTGSSRFAWSIGYAALLALCAYGVGLPDLARSRRSTALGLAAVASTIAALGVSVVQLLVGDALLPRYVVFGSALVLVPWGAFCAEISRGGRARAEGRDRVLLVAGSSSDAELVERELERAAERPATVVGVLSPAAARSSDGRDRPLERAAEARRVTVLVLDRAAQADETIVSQAAALHAAGTRVRTFGLFYEEWLGKLPVSELERVSLMFDIGELHRARYGRVKRVIDIAAGLVGIVLLVVLAPAVALGDLVANRGPLFFRQERVGKDGTVFSILKFRTMRAAGPGEVPSGAWTTKGDARVTPFGRILRRTHLDEVPQFVNILRGELSLVGPRPEQPRYVEELRTKIPFYDVRHLVRPGLTGWAQVKYGYAGSEADALEKLQYEIFYLRRQSSTLDLRIIGRTARHVLGFGGR